MWDFFDRKVCLTNNPVEWEKGLAEFQRVGLSDVQRFEALPEIGPHQSFNSSERRILIDFLHSQAQTLLHLEDDCSFLSLDHLPAALAQLPEDWDIVYLGANIVDPNPERVSRNLYRLRDAWTTHAVGYNKKVVRWILENQPGFSERMYDNWLGSQLPNLKAFVINPMAAWQRPRFSSIWERDTNYDDVFLASQGKLMTNGVHLVTYSDETMTISAARCEESARAHNAELVWRWDKAELQATEFYAENKEILDVPRGAGLWAWKPYVILDTMRRRCSEGDILIYSDAGVEIVENLRYVIDRMDQDVFLFGNMWEHAHFCKRDCLEKIWPLDLDRLKKTTTEAPEDLTFGDWWQSEGWARFGKQVQASVIFFRVSDFSRRFVQEWLDWCLFEGGRLLDDSPSRAPNHSEFSEHRHDQAILTTLAYRDGLKLHWWPAMYNGGAFSYEKGVYTDFYPVLFHHHRKRNDQW
jgi:hypothetical protein